VEGVCEAAGDYWWVFLFVFLVSCEGNGFRFFFRVGEFEYSWFSG